MSRARLPCPVSCKQTIGSVRLAWSMWAMMQNIGGSEKRERRSYALESPFQGSQWDILGIGRQAQSIPLDFPTKLSLSPSSAAMDGFQPRPKTTQASLPPGERARSQDQLSRLLQEVGPVRRW